MKQILLVTALLISQAVMAGECITFDERDYCEIWNNKAEDMHTIELLSKGQSLESWSSMITIRNYDGKSALKEVLPGYVKGVQPMFALEPDFLVNENSSNTEEVYLRMLLLAPDKSHYEYVINRFYRGDDNSVKSIFYSHRIPFAKEINYEEIMKNRDGWLEQLQHQSVEAYFSE